MVHPRLRAIHNSPHFTQGLSLFWAVSEARRVAVMGFRHAVAVGGHGELLVQVQRCGGIQEMSCYRRESESERYRRDNAELWASATLRDIP